MKTYTAEEVLLILLGASNNYVSEIGKNSDEGIAITDFAKWAVKSSDITTTKMDVEHFCERELAYGEKALSNLERNGTLFRTKKEKELLLKA